MFYGVHLETVDTRNACYNGVGKTVSVVDHSIYVGV